MSEPVLITTEHCRELKYCYPAMVRFAKKYDLNMREFVKNGLMSDKYPQEDSHTQALIEVATKGDSE